MLFYLSILLAFPTTTIAAVSSVDAELASILPIAPLATISPGFWASENPSAFETFAMAYTSIILDNPTYLSSAFESIITEVPAAAATSVYIAEPSAFPTLFTSVILAEPTLFPTLFTSVAEDIFLEAVPQTLLQLYSTNPAAGSSYIKSEFANGDPSWYTQMPTPVQSYIEALDTSVPGAIQPTIFRTIVQTVSIQATSTSSSGGAGSGGSGGLSTGAQAGIGVGVGLAGLIAIIAGLCFCLRRRKAKKHNITNVAQQPEMVPAGAYHNNTQPQASHQSQYYGGAPAPGPAGYYAHEEPKYAQEHGGTGVQPGPYQPYQQAYQQPYQQSTSPPPQHNSQYYSPPPAPYGSPPQEGFYHEKSPMATNGQVSPAVGTGTLVSENTGSSSAGHGIGTGGATELSAGRTSVESMRHEMPADSRH